MSGLLGYARVEVGVRKPVCLDAREEPEEGRCVRDVEGLRFAGAAREETADAAKAVDDDRARITWDREGAGLVVVGEDSPLYRSLVSVVVVILTDVGENTVSAAYSDARGFAILYDQQARFTIVVGHIWAVHQVFRDDVSERKEAVIWIHKVRDGVVHHHCKLVQRNLRP